MVTLILFTLVVSLGTLVANRIGGTIVGRFEVNELHRSISIIAVVFLVIHIVTTVVDSFVATGWISVFIPMTSAYRRIPIGIGAVAFDLLLAVWISSLLKVRIANQTWRFIHWFSWLAFATAIVHAYTSGTDTRKGIGLIVVVICAGVVAGAGVWRFLGRPSRAAGRTALTPLAAANETTTSMRTGIKTQSLTNAPPPRAAAPGSPQPPPFARGPLPPSKQRDRK
jgi:predicted ferric reductase